MAERHRAAVFLDKDGTLVEDLPFDVSSLRLTEGAREGLPRLHQAGFRLFVISNQSGVALGRFSERELKLTKNRLLRLLARLGAPLTDFYYCPHHPEAVAPEFAKICCCRKPKPGLLFSASFDHGINLGESWFIGDILNDVEAGRRAGCRTILMDNGHETEWRLTPLRSPHFIVKDLREASKVILRSGQSKFPETSYAGKV